MVTKLKKIVKCIVFYQNILPKEQSRKKTPGLALDFRSRQMTNQIIVKCYFRAKHLFKISHGHLLLLKLKNFYRYIQCIQKLMKAIKFSFQQVTEKHVRQVILSIYGSKATAVAGIPADTLKITLDIHILLITKIINLSLENECFPDDLKLAEVSPSFKKNDDLDKENYRPCQSFIYCVKGL